MLAQVDDIGITFEYTLAFVENIDDKVVSITHINDNNELITEKLDLNSFSLEDKGIKIGMEVYVKGEKFEEVGKSILTSIEPLTPYNSNKIISFEGRIDDIQGSFVYIDGNKVSLARKGKIQGVNGWEDNDFNSVRDLKLGAWAKVKGMRVNGILTAKSLVTYPNTYKVREIPEFQELVNYYDDFYAIWSDKELRKELYGKETAIGKVYDSDDVQLFIERIGYSLIPEYAKKTLNFSFVVVEDGSFNASMTPVGLCIVHTGLITSSENEAQIAAVLGHEIAHATYQHSLQQVRMEQDIAEKREKREKRKEAASKFGPLSDVITIVTPEGAEKIEKAKEVYEEVTDVLLDKPKRRNEERTDVMDLLVETLNFKDEKVFFNYNREQETQSDRVGLYYLVQAGYDPREAPMIWKKLYEKGSHNHSHNTPDTAENLSKIIDVMSKKESGNDFFENRRKKESMVAFKSHPDDLKRYKDLNKLIAFYWSTEDIIDNSIVGAVFDW